MDTIVGQHGTLMDYFTSMPLPNFTLTDGQNMTTSDAQGNWVLPAPLGVAENVTVTGPAYTNLFLSELIATSPGVNRGPIPIPNAMSFALEQQILAADPSLAIVQISILRRSSCASLAGATLNVTSPAGATVGYFTGQGLPTGLSMIDRDQNRPVVAVSNVPVGQRIEFELVHPTCKIAAAGASIDGGTFTGNVTTMAAEPGDNTSSVVYIAE